MTHDTMTYTVGAYAVRLWRVTRVIRVVGEKLDTAVVSVPVKIEVVYQTFVFLTTPSGNTGSDQGDSTGLPSRRHSETKIHPERYCARRLGLASNSISFVASALHVGLASTWPRQSCAHVSLELKWPNDH